MKRALSSFIRCSSRPAVSNFRGGQSWFCSVSSPETEAVASSVLEPESVIKRESLKNILNTRSPGDEVRIQGWVRAFRKQKYITFLEVNDGSTHHRIPVVCPAKFAPEDLGMHTAVDMSGILQPSPKNSTVVELHPTAPIHVVGPCDQKTYPFGGKIRYEDEYIRQFLHLRSKTNRFSSLFRLRSKATRAVHDYFHSNDYVQIHTPILTSNDCEGAGEVFVVRPANEDLMKEKPKAKPERPVSPVKITKIQTHDHSDLPFDGQKHTHRHKCEVCDNVFEHTHNKKPAYVSKSYDNHYCEEHAHLRKDPNKEFNPDEAFFDRKAYLTVSGQLHLEAMASGLDKVWTFSPVFRSENAQSTRHLAEFYMVEAELAFAYEIQQILEPMEQLVKDVIHAMVYDSSYEFSIFSESNTELREMLDKILKHPFTVMTFKEASDILASKGNSVVQPDHGLNREQELLLVEKLNNGVPVFVIDWPTNIKPFYMRETPDDPSLCSAVDLLVPGVGELCGGSLREHRAAVLESRMKAIDPTGKLQASLEWYLDLRRFGSVPTGGFGLGFDRLMQLVTGIRNIKDVTAFPRVAKPGKVPAWKSPMAPKLTYDAITFLIMKVRFQDTMFSANENYGGAVPLEIWASIQDGKVGLDTIIPKEWVVPFLLILGWLGPRFIQHVWQMADCVGSNIELRIILFTAVQSCQADDGTIFNTSIAIVADLELTFKDRTPKFLEIVRAVSRAICMFGSFHVHPVVLPATELGLLALLTAWYVTWKILEFYLGEGELYVPVSCYIDEMTSLDEKDQFVLHMRRVFKLYAPEDDLDSLLDDAESRSYVLCQDAILKWTYHIKERSLPHAQVQVEYSENGYTITTTQDNIDAMTNKWVQRCKGIVYQSQYTVMST